MPLSKETKGGHKASNLSYLFVVSAVFIFRPILMPIFIPVTGRI